jgi:hypothetical protein
VIVATWIFQATPKDFRIDDFVKTSPSECLWRVSRYQRELRLGDTVFLWRAKGNTNIEGGIFGRAEIIRTAILIAPDFAQQDFWISTSDKYSKEPRALLGAISLNDSCNPICRTTLMNDPITGNLSILSQAQGTNFRVSEPEARRLVALLQSHRTPFSRDDLSTVLAAYVGAGMPPPEKVVPAIAVEVAIKIGRTVPLVRGEMEEFAKLCHDDPRVTSYAPPLRLAVWKERATIMTAGAPPA